MCIVSEISGKNLCLRLVIPEDAEFIYGLRIDPTYNMYLSKLTGTVDDQKTWIAAYKAREAAGKEGYYIIERLDGVPCGTVRLYQITLDRFTWGSFILKANKPPKAALESAVLSFEIGFTHLGRGRADIDVRRENWKAIDFYRRFGMVETGSDTENLYFEFTPSGLDALRETVEV